MDRTETRTPNVCRPRWWTDRWRTRSFGSRRKQSLKVKPQRLVDKKPKTYLT